MSLTPHDIARMLDHSTLQPFLTEDDIRRGCELALKYDTASVCARPCDVPILAEMLRGSDVKVCTVIGFPHGAHATQIKVDEARLALDQGCEELDMVINIGEMIRGNEAYVQDEIKQICDLAHSRNAIVKVILETCYLTDAQKKDVSNYDTFLRQKAKFQTLLEEYRAACLKELENYYNKLNRSTCGRMTAFSRNARPLFPRRLPPRSLNPAK